MMNYIWGTIIVISVLCALVTGRINILSSSVLSGANDAIALTISILGMMAFWTGIMKIAEKSGITDFISKIFAPIVKFLFPEHHTNSPAAKAICMNITANLLGLGNAATPFGVKAMQQMQKHNQKPNTATNSMAMFIVVNTASLQIIPTFLCTLRQKHGSNNPLDIIAILWLTSIIALIAGIITAKFFENRKCAKNE